MFDTEPAREVVTLPDLLRSLRRFECRTDTAAAVEREVVRVRPAGADPEAGGPVGAELARVRAAALATGADPARAVVDAAAALEKHARKDAKRDLPLWSPALYAEGAKRGTEGVSALSCLVLDYDAGATFALPACPSAEAPRFGVVHAGELFDPLLEGLVSMPYRGSPPEPSRGPSRLARSDSKRVLLDD